MELSVPKAKLAVPVAWPPSAQYLGPAALSAQKRLPGVHWGGTLISSDFCEEEYPLSWG